MVVCATLSISLTDKTLDDHESPPTWYLASAGKKRSAH